MVEPIELRIKNYINLPLVGMCKIESINSGNGKNYRLIGIVDLNGKFVDRVSSRIISPANLTIGLLYKLGFVKVKPRSGIMFAYKKGGVRINVSNSGNFYWKNKPVPYVHLLQNIYYFNQLTGEELTIK